ncbi:MFS transporter [Saccharopolyspora thermophila]|uniref:MFS transporter n=1 Tax=Saccharopolyspora thermophila TaxID=89367 RepID=A0ABP3N5U0_9PSEU
MSVNATDPVEQTRPQQADRHRWRVLGICLVAGFMTLLDVSIVNVALPSIQLGLNAPATALAWVVSGYALTFGLVLVPAGRLGDDRGRGRMFLLALALFTAASALCGFAPEPLWLVVARLLQGAAGGMLSPQVLGLMQQLFHGRDRGRAFGLFGAVVGISTAIGPLLGGLIIQLAGAEDGWRWVFFVNLPIGAAAILYGLRVLPRDVPADRASSLDLAGVLLLGGGLLCLLLPLIEQESRRGTPWYLLAVAAVLLALFVVWEHLYQARGRAPLVNLRLLTIRSYSFGAGLALLYFAGFTGIFFVLAVYFQRGLGYSALLAGLALTPFAVGSAVSSALSGRIVHRLGRRLVIIGLVAALAGLMATDLLLAAHPGPAVGWVTALPLLVAGAGSGLVISPNQTVSLSEIDPGYGGIAAGVQQTGQRIGSAVGTAAASGLFFGTLSEHGFDAAIASGLLVSVGFVAASLLVAVAEALVRRHTT